MSRDWRASSHGGRAWRTISTSGQGRLDAAHEVDLADPALAARREARLGAVARLHLGEELGLVALVEPLLGVPVRGDLAARAPSSRRPATSRPAGRSRTGRRTARATRRARHAPRSRRSRPGAWRRSVGLSGRGPPRARSRRARSAAGGLSSTPAASCARRRLAASGSSAARRAFGRCLVLLEALLEGRVRGDGGGVPAVECRGPIRVGLGGPGEVLERAQVGQAGRGSGRPSSAGRRWPRARAASSASPGDRRRRTRRAGPGRAGRTPVVGDRPSTSRATRTPEEIC